jgi:hypothetical protein
MTVERLVGRVVVGADQVAWILTTDATQRRLRVVDAKFDRAIGYVPCYVGGPNAWDDAIELEAEVDSSRNEIVRVLGARITRDDDCYELDVQQARFNPLQR